MRSLRGSLQLIEAFNGGLAQVLAVRVKQYVAVRCSNTYCNGIGIFTSCKGRSRNSGRGHETFDCL